MRSCRLFPFVLLAFGASFLSGRAALAAPPASPAGTRVAIVNPSRVFAEMRETKTLRETLDAKKKQLAAMEVEKRKEIENMIQDRDSNYNPKHPKYLEICRQIDQKKAEFQMWGTTIKADVERDQKLMVKNLYDKIEAATAQIAQQQGIDLVLADGRQDIASLEDVPPEELRRMLNTRAVIYATKAVDITDSVLALVNVQFGSGGGAGPTVPPPIPGPATSPPK